MLLWDVVNYLVICLALGTAKSIMMIQCSVPVLYGSSFNIFSVLSEPNN